MIERRHQDALLNRLEEVPFRGFCELQMHELYRWFGRKRLTTNVFQHINDSLLELFVAQGVSRPKISVLPLDSGYLILDSEKLVSMQDAFKLGKA